MPSGLEQLSSLQVPSFSHFLQLSRISSAVASFFFYLYSFSLLEPVFVVPPKTLLNFSLDAPFKELEEEESLS